jgi:CDP-diacylglycerol---serine O-phosphatidyltransferase
MRSRLRSIDMRKALFVLPNLFTLSSVLCSFYAMSLLTKEGIDGRGFLAASCAIMFAMFFDAADGRVARLTKTQSDFGVQLDSLADLVSFGVAPALLVYRWSLYHLGDLGLLFAFVFVAAGACRLARFNVLVARGIDSSRDFVGLAIPLAAFCLIAGVIAGVKVGSDPELVAPYLSGFTVLVALLQVSTIRYRSYKDWRLTPGSGALLVVSVGGPLAVALWLGQAALMLIIVALLYVMTGLLGALFGRRGEADETPEVSP